RQVVSWMCEAPARVWNLHQKGAIREGWDADLVLVDLNRTAVVRNEEQLTKCGWTPWDGVSLTGWPVRTFVHGQTVFCDGRVVGEGTGREILYDRQQVAR
ncbi:MAG: amidohydrolase family protein, partial [Planctomyces sp.]